MSLSDLQALDSLLAEVDVKLSKAQTSSPGTLLSTLTAVSDKLAANELHDLAQVEKRILRNRFSFLTFVFVAEVVLVLSPKAVAEHFALQETVSKLSHSFKTLAVETEEIKNGLKELSLLAKKGTRSLLTQKSVKF